MSRLWYPLYEGDFLKDTMNLSPRQELAYRRMISHYMQKNCLPNSDAELAQIARMDARMWRASKPVLAAFFEMPGWRHPRIEKEIEKARAISEKRARAGRIGGLMNVGRSNAQRSLAADLRRANARAIAEASASPGPKQMLKQTDLQMDGQTHKEEASINSASEIEAAPLPVEAKRADLEAVYARKRNGTAATPAAAGSLASAPDGGALAAPATAEVNGLLPARSPAEPPKAVAEVSKPVASPQLAAIIARRGWAP